jgi:hypothetical protein
VHNEAAVLKTILEEAATITTSLKPEIILKPVK